MRNKVEIPVTAINAKHMGILEIGRGILDAVHYKLLSLDPQFIKTHTQTVVASRDESVRVRVLMTREKPGEGAATLHRTDSSYPIHCRASDIVIIEEQGYPIRAMRARRLNNQTIF